MSISILFSSPYEFNLFGVRLIWGRAVYYPGPRPVGLSPWASFVILSRKARQTFRSQQKQASVNSISSILMKELVERCTP